MEPKDKKKTWLFDIILVAVLLTVALSAFLIFYFTRDTSDPESAKTVVVRYENEVIATFPLCEDGEHKINGGTHTIRIKDGRVSVTRSSCPGYQDCVEKGEISEEWEKIVCLPYRLMITVEEGE